MTCASINRLPRNFDHSIFPSGFYRIGNAVNCMQILDTFHDQRYPNKHHQRDGVSEEIQDQEKRKYSSNKISNFSGIPISPMQCFETFTNL